MYHTRRNVGTRRPSRSSRHAPSASQDTNASGIADSTISYGESLRLSQFPNPPASIPSTPILSEFGTPSPGHSAFNLHIAPLVPQRKHQSNSNAGPSAASSSSAHLNSTARTESPVYSTHSQATTTHHQTRDLYPHPPSTAHTLSPYDWHDGASSIGMDATEDRLLSTSFITSLLQEHAGTRANHRASYGSDALSGFSEMTYPPLASSFSDDQSSRRSPSARTLPQRPQGARPPPSAFNPIPESPDRLSGDSATLYSNMDHNPSVLRKASISRLHNTQGASVVGMMPATLHSVSKNGGIPSYRDPDDMSQYKGGYSSLPYPYTPARSPKDSSQTPQNRGSMHSAKSAVPSFISRISSHSSVRRVLAWRRVKPLPPVPTIPNIPIATEIEQRRVDESRPLPELVNRAGALQGLLEKGYHPHRSLNSHYVTPKGEGLISAFDDGDTIIRGDSSVDVQHDDGSGKPLRNLTINRHNVSDNSRFKENIIPKKKKRTLIVLGAFLVVALAAVGTAVGISLHRKGNALPTCSGNLVGATCNLS
jgi:hypothetical protein